MKIGGGERPLRGVPVGLLPGPVLPVPLKKISGCAGNERVTDFGKNDRIRRIGEARRRCWASFSIFLPFLSFPFLTHSPLVVAIIIFLSCVAVAVAAAAVVIVAIYLSFISFLVLTDLILPITIKG
jgi:hypothetical protein